MKLKYWLSCAAVCFVFGGCSLTAGAYSADDVAAKARAAGWPEYLIQEGYNQWSSGEYTQAQLDQAYASVSDYDEKTGKMISNSLGIRYQEAPAQPENADTSAASAETPAAESTPASAATVTKTDGTTEERIPTSEFIKMSLEEKQAYVASLSEESKVAFMETLTPEERRSIIKQLPAEDKASLVQEYIGAAADMGMNVSVDNISGSDISMTIRNSEGTVIGKTAVGTVIDETGISHTVPYLGALAAVAFAVAGIGFVNRRNERES